MEKWNEMLFSKEELGELMEKGYRYYRRNRNCVHVDFMMGVEYILKKIGKIKK